jgi:hypothetical protein
MVKKKIDKRNNPNLGLFQNAKGTFESPLDIPLIVNGKEMTVIELLSIIVKMQIEIERDVNAFKETFKKYAEAENINDTAIAKSLDAISKRLFKLENVGNIWGTK